jgi:exopolyphosphatase / guanosine-5'-triphosphate,3'-diphosphate pyrophosphatase
LKKDVIAVIDLGSNSIQLALYQTDAGGHCHYYETKRVKATTRLANYLSNNGKITKDGIDLIITTLKKYQKIIQSYEVDQLIGFATAVIRRAANQGEVLKEIQRQTNITFRVLSEYEEAYYGYLSVIQSMDLQDGITIDIGGGSTEITLFQNKKMIHYHSFPFGAVTLTQQFSEEEPYLLEYLENQLNKLSWLQKAKLPVVGIGGSAKNLARIFHFKSSTEQSELKLRNIDEILLELLSLDLNERSKIKGLSKRRTSIIIPAMQTISTLMKVTQSPNFVYCNKTVRDGLIYELFTNKSKINI